MHFELQCSSGIFSASATSCVPSAINHAVTIVGYGTSGGTLYWVIIKIQESSFVRNLNCTMLTD